MAIQDILNNLLSEKLMKNMQQHMVDGLNQVYKDAIFEGDTNMEVVRSRDAYPSLFDRLNASDDKLADKAEKTYVDSKIGNMGNTKTFKGSCTNVELLAKTSMIVDDYWYVTDLDTNKAYNGTSWIDIGNNINFGDGVITPAKLSFGKQRYNLFDYTKIKSGKTMSIGGVISNNPAFDMIEIKGVEPLKTYFFDRAFQVIEINSSGGVVANKTDVNSLGMTIYTNQATSKVVINFASSLKLNYQTVFACKKEFKNFCLFDKVPFVNDESKFKTMDKISYLKQLSAFEKTANLFDKEMARIDYAIDGVNGFYYYLASFNSSDYMPIFENTSYKTTSLSRVAFFDVNYNFLSFVNNVTSFISPIGSALAIAHTQESIDTFMFFKETDNLVTYTPCYRLKRSLYDGPDKIHTSYYGNTLMSIGDSTAKQEMWQPYVISSLGFGKHYNHGYSGYQTYQLYSDAILSSLETDVDTILILTGLNDWANNVPLGDVDDIANDSMAYRMYMLLTKLIVKYPLTQIVVLTPTYGTLPNQSGFTDSGRLNLLGLSTLDYGNIIEKVCAKLNNPCIAVGKNTGWNNSNIATFVQDDGGFLHVNEKGGKRVASVVIGGLKAIEPIV